MSKYASLRLAIVDAIRTTLDSLGYDAALADGAGESLKALLTTATAERTCSGCLVDKPLTEFYLAGGKPEYFCKPCRAETTRKWRSANPGWELRMPGRAKHLADQRAAAKAHPERAIEGTRRWRKKYPERARLQDRICARLRRNPELRDRIMARDKRRCLCCGKGKDLVVDHIKPVLRGGDNDPGNLQTLCRACNTRKRGEIDYRRRIGGGK